MEREVQERFERIELNLESVTKRLDRVTEHLDGVTERLDRVTEAHLDLEAAQKNTTVRIDRVVEAIDRFVEETRTRGKEVDERIANLTILVDRLIERDLGRS